MYIDYDYYRTFYYVAKYGNITQAAKILLNNQPNLTRVIKNMESSLGCVLFIRNNRGMKLTPEGERLYEHVRIAVEHIEAGEAEIEESANMKRGSVYIAASEVALHCVLLPVLKEYRKIYPTINLKISNHSTPQAIDALKNGLADFAIVTTPTVSSAVTEEITVRKFREVVVCGTVFSEQIQDGISFSALSEYPLISLSPQTKSYELYSEFFAEEGTQFRPTTEAATADQILPMVKADLGIGFLPKEFLRSEKEVRVIKTQKPLPEREIRIIKRKEQTLSIAAAKLEKLILGFQQN